MISLSICVLQNCKLCLYTVPMPTSYKIRHYNYFYSCCSSFYWFLNECCVCFFQLFSYFGFLDSRSMSLNLSVLPLFGLLHSLFAFTLEANCPTVHLQVSKDPHFQSSFVWSQSEWAFTPEQMKRTIHRNKPRSVETIKLGLFSFQAFQIQCRPLFPLYIKKRLWEVFGLNYKTVRCIFWAQGCSRTWCTGGDTRHEMRVNYEVMFMQNSQ